ncbi:unnamed protein product [Brassica rapa subsp. narinosa]
MWLFSASITRLNNLNKRTRDVMASSLYLPLHHSATLCHDALDQVLFVKNVIKPRNFLFSFCFGYTFNVSFCECSKHF